MLFTRAIGAGSTTLYLLHFLGGSGREWEKVSSLVANDLRCVAIDLPGFGDSAHVAGYSVSAMADAVSECIRADGSTDWLLIGHSMGAKVAAVIARQIEDGRSKLNGLRGLILLAGSPPSPEPIPDQRRETMESWFAGDTAESLTQATKFIDNNTAQPLNNAAKAQAIDDVLRMNRAAWLAWLDAGSREDWSERVGVLHTPTLILAGEKDEDLGPAAQQKLMLPHFAHAHMEVIAGARHLLPIESPESLAGLIKDHVTRIEFSSRPHPLDPDDEALIYSDRVSEATRRVLLKRVQAEESDYIPKALSVEELSTLRAVLTRILPQSGPTPIDLAQYIDRQILGPGDGWRFARLPRDQEAYSAALRTLEYEAHKKADKPFDQLDVQSQDELLQQAASGALHPGVIDMVISRLGLVDQTRDALLDAEQMRLWCADVRADAVKVYMAHPATLARIGYSGNADGGNSETMQGFVSIGTGETEPWEPRVKPVTR